MSVRSWPTYLLRDIPDWIRVAIETDAATEEISMAEVVREIFCAHYGLECEAVEASAKSNEFIPGTATMILRIQPELFAAINQDVQKEPNRYGAKKKVVLGILKAHYNGGHPHD